MMTSVIDRIQVCGCSPKSKWLVSNRRSKFDLVIDEPVPRPYQSLAVSGLHGRIWEESLIVPGAHLTKLVYLSNKNNCDRKRNGGDIVKMVFELSFKQQDPGCQREMNVVEMSYRDHE
jgi:hypothetical protein